MIPPKPPGQLFDIGDDAGGPWRLHLQGQGRPATVLDSGLWGNSLLWTNALAAIAPLTEAAAFDRPGNAWSEPAPAGRPRTSRQMVDELRRLLSAAGLEPPYILIGHSFGAINMLVYAISYPAEVAGMVLVDPSHPEMVERVRGVPPAKTMAVSYSLFSGLGRLGLLRWLGPLFLGQILPAGQDSLPPEAWQALQYFSRQRQSFAAAAREAGSGAESFAQARGAPGCLGDLPLDVLTAEWWVSGKPTPMKQGMVAVVKELAGYSSCGRHSIVSGCDHTNLPVVRADAVAEAVCRVLALAVN
jgi:pimeloyl-ACP methyl ester carboxylesterase